ncbi:DUF4259 domain-containing protein [Streptomyces mirabilis]|uniref:DUF4259 domain-containing protein n=1 Tax=Streptomyces mirabilis TaxID=68239 RepID=UPI0021BF4379|nr:DUF4259 domain-containing protein [Streptomyces mirabilis]MCT9113450.1 DUF4259 domain-containing protein [Streptomyces mirabilis]
MGTWGWGTGPFDSDMAADFVDGLAGKSPEQVIEAMARAFQRVMDAPHLVALVRAGARFERGQLAERPESLAA